MKCTNTAEAKYARDSLSEGQEREEQQENKYWSK